MKIQRMAEIYGLRETTVCLHRLLNIAGSLERDCELSLNDLESELEVYSEIFKNDIEFTKDLSKKLAWAVLRNYSLLDDYVITPFIEYIKSAPIRTVHLINPIWYVEFFGRSKILNIRIEYFDIKNNMYDPIEISTKLVGDRKDKIDLYKLFKWELA